MNQNLIALKLRTCVGIAKLKEQTAEDIVGCATDVLTKEIIIAFGEWRDDKMSAATCLGLIHVCHRLIAFGFASVSSPPPPAHLSGYSCQRIRHSSPKVFLTCKYTRNLYES
jgi:hypothetical protein